MSGERRTQPGLELPSSLRRRLQTALARFWHNGYLKLAAFLVAVVFWVFVRNDNALISQRTFQAPLNIEGLSAAQLAPGVPERVEVRLSGPSSRIRTISAEGVDVVLNLRDVSGDFEQDVRVFPPQGITLLGVTPREIIGTVETRERKRVPVQAVLSSAAPSDGIIEVSPSPSEVVVSGAASLVAQVTRVLVPFSPEQPRDRAVPYAVDATGEPIAEITITPAQLRLTAARRDILYTKRVPLVLSPLPGLEVQSAKLTLLEITVAGPKAALAGLTQVEASLPETPKLTPGQYTLDVSLALPEGVSALEVPQLTLQLRAPRQDQDSNEQNTTNQLP